MLGGYKGQVFKLGVGNHDGVSTGTSSGTFTAATTSISTITDLTATFETSGAGLIERKITILDSNDVIKTTATVRPRVAAHTATALTLSAPVGGLTVGDVYTYIVGGPDWQFDTAWRDFDAPFDEKRLEFVYFHGLLYGASLLIDIIRNKKHNTLVTERFTTLTGGGSLWDAVIWDAFVWDDTNVSYAKVRGGQTGVAFALRFRNPYGRQPLTVVKTGFRVEMLSDKVD
jgi:hypothetical protein